MAPPQLWSIAQSPWSLRAKWALEHARVEYQNHEYVPVNPFASFWLRYKLRRWRITLPILFTTQGRAITESYDIAAFADEKRADGIESMMVDGVKHWEDLSQIVMQAERTRVFAEMPERPSVVAPAVVLRLFGFLITFVVRMFCQSMQNKYPAPYDVEVVRSKLKAIRAQLQKQQWRYILDTFSYADMAVVVALHSVKAAEAYFQVVPFAKQVWCDRAFADDFQDLFDWRDAVLQKHWV